MRLEIKKLNEKGKTHSVEKSSNEPQKKEEDEENEDKGEMMTMAEKMAMRSEITSQARKEADSRVAIIQDNLKLAEDSLNAKSEELSNALKDYEQICSANLNLIKDKQTFESQFQLYRIKVSDLTMKVDSLLAENIALKRVKVDLENEFKMLEMDKEKLEKKFEAFKQKAVVGTNIIPFFIVKKIGLIPLVSTVVFTYVLIG